MIRHTQELFCRTREGDILKRRILLQLAGASLLVPGIVRSQAEKRHRLGWLFSTDPATTKPLFDAFLHRMRELGYVEGRNLANDVRWAAGDVSRFPALAEELIALKPDVLLGIQETALAMRQKTSVIPIVLVSSSNPVEVGLVKSLARPGTNVTGITGVYDQLVVKQIELLTELMPTMSRVGFLINPLSPSFKLFEQAVAKAAAAKRLTVTTGEAQNREQVHRAFARFAEQRVQGLVVHPSGTMTFLRREIAQQASRLRIPAISGMSQFADAGGLVNYSPHFLQPFGNEIPRIVDQILKGAKPADLPVQQVTGYNVVINLKTAREIGLAVPQQILLRADRVIE